MRVYSLKAAQVAALMRFAAINHLEDLIRGGQTLAEAFRETALLPWPDEHGDVYAVRTIEDWWYAYNKSGVNGLVTRPRADRGQPRALEPKQAAWVLDQVMQNPTLPVKVLHARWQQEGHQLPSLRSVYRSLNAQGLDSRALRTRRLVAESTKALEKMFAEQRRARQDGELQALTDLHGRVPPKTAMRVQVVNHLENLIRRGHTLASAFRNAARSPWPEEHGEIYSVRTIEDWWYTYQKKGVHGLLTPQRSDVGQSRVLTADQVAWVLAQVNDNPTVGVKALHARWQEEGRQLPSLGSVYRCLSSHGLDGRTLRARRQEAESTKALEVALAKENQTSQDGMSWMLSVLQGRVPLQTLTLELESALKGEEIAVLYRCVTNSALRFRNRALARLSLKKGIATKVIQRFLGVSENYVGQLEARIQEKGLGCVGRNTHKGLLKYEQDVYKSAVFAILHSPPSVHGINRTTWRLKDIHKVMSQQGLSIATSGITRIIRSAGFKFYKARKVLTSNDPDYNKKLQDITSILRNLKPDEKFVSVDEYGPFAVKIQGGRSLMRPGDLKSVPQYQKSKGSLILTAALELSTNQVTHFYSNKKNTDEMLKLLEILLVKYADQACIYFSWDAASWHASKKFCKRVEENNSAKSQATQRTPLVKLAPLPSCAQFLNVIESVFSGMAKAVIHNSNYQSVEECQVAIDRHFDERNQHFKDHPKRAGKKIWGQELVPPVFNEANNCKDPRYRGGPH